jgi:Fimbrial assembly protein (PilN)
MINLLPDEFKKEVIAGRSNVKLVNYILILTAGIIFLSFISVAVYFVILGIKANAESAIATNQSKSSSYATVQAQATALRTSLLTAKTTLDKEIAYTKVLTGVAAVIPDGVVLQALSLSPSTLGTPLTLQAYARSNDDAIRLKDSFQQSPYFSNVSFTSLATNGSGEYPVTVTINVTINRSIAQ